jgi:DNA-binding response OmpR family regulator
VQGQVKTILICEDDENLRQLIRVVIGAGYRVLEAADGEVAVALARAEHPDLIVLDLMMPRMSGLDVLQSLREDEAAPQAHIVVMSAWPHSQETALAAGANTFLPKPFQPAELTAIVTDVLGGPG